MRSITKKMMIYSLAGMLQLGFGASIIEASPLHNDDLPPVGQQYDQYDQRGAGPNPHERDRMERERPERERAENERHEHEMKRRPHESRKEWHKRQQKEIERHERALREIREHREHR
jgi:membrane protein involved in colicin uptake